MKLMDRISFHVKFYGENERNIFLPPPRRIRIRMVLQVLKYEILKNERNLKLLDIGCNDGSISELIKKSYTNIEIYGIDLVHDLLKKAHEKGINVIVSDAEKHIPFKDATFDIVYAGEILEHIYDTDFLIKEIRRILKYNGILLITVPNVTSLPNRIRILLGLYPKGVTPALNFYELGGHIRVFNRDVIKKLLENNGFRVKRIFSNMVCFSPTKKTSLPWSTFLGKIFPDLGETLIIIASAI